MALLIGYAVTGRVSVKISKSSLLDCCVPSRLPSIKSALNGGQGLTPETTYIKVLLLYKSTQVTKGMNP